MATNKEIVEIYLNNGLIKECVKYQFAKWKQWEYQEDFFQDLVLILLEYDNEKLNDAHLNNHFNALVTRIIINNIYSKTSPFYKAYIKQSSREQDITEKELLIPDGD